MAESKTEDEAVSKVLGFFNLTELKDEQRAILECLLEKRDCIAVLPTGFGKSLPFQMFVSVRRLQCPDDDVGKVIVVSPLLALMKDQVTKLSQIPDITARYKGDSEEGDAAIENGDFNYLFLSPEALASEGYRSKLQKLNVEAIVVDEFHTMYTWGGLDKQNEEVVFRRWFRHIGELRSMFPTATMLALSATCTKDIYKAVSKALNLSKAFTNIIIKSPEKSNIKFCTMKIDASVECSMQWIVDAMENLTVDFPRTIIYANTIKQLSDVYMYLHDEIPNCMSMIEMFHSETPPDKKNYIIEMLQDSNSNLRILIATSALGMGVDIKGCNSVVLYGAPPNVVDLLQEVGRVGRDGKAAVALLLYNRYHLAQMGPQLKSIYTSDNCRRKSIMEHFIPKSQIEQLVIGVHSCCDVCQRKCDCGQCGKLTIENLFYGQDIDDEHYSTSSSDTELYDYQDYIQDQLHVSVGPELVEELFTDFDS